MGTADGIGTAVDLIEGHRNLGPVWVGLWESETSERFRRRWQATVVELRSAIVDAMGSLSTQRPCMADSDGQDEAADSVAMESNSRAVPGLDEVYAGVVERLGLRAGHQRGSGILTTVAAAALAWAAHGDAHGSVVAAANAVGTDTDTIATMAGALLGACDTAADPPEEPLDSACLLREADRLTAISRGEPTNGHSYPDLLTWAAPKSQADALVSHNGDLVVEGLGPVTPLETEPVYTPRGDFAWQWVRTHPGQTLLIKRRPELKAMRERNNTTPPTAPPSTTRSHRQPGSSKPRKQPDSDPNPGRSGRAPRSSRWRTPKAIAYAKSQTSDDGQLGPLVRRVAQEGTRGDFLTVMRELYDELQH